MDTERDALTNRRDSQAEYLETKIDPEKDIDLDCLCLFLAIPLTR
jgi:hypothetical protein